jgi:hypothetical protein
MMTKSRLTLLLALVLASLLVACQSSNQPTETTSNEAAGTQAAKGTRGRRGAGAAPAATEEKVTVPAGTALSVRLNDTVDTGKTSAGSTFEGTLAQALTVQGMDVAPVGSAVAGKVTNAVSSGRLNRPAELALTLTSLTPTGGSAVDISTDTWSAKGESHKKRNLEMIGGGAGVGALVGAIAGGKKGAAIGGAVGAGAGTGAAAYTGKKEIVLPAETKLEFKLSAPITLTVKKK